MGQLDDLGIEEDGTLRLQPCFSPVWDTALSLIALADAGKPGDSEEVRSRRPLAARQGSAADRATGRRPSRRRTGRLVLRVPQRLLPRHRRHGDGADRAGPHRPLRSAPRRSRRFIARSTGSWRCRTRTAAGPRSTATSTTRSWRTCRSPTTTRCSTRACPDITARVLEALSHYGFRVGQQPVDRAVAFIVSRQEDDGRWFGRWGVNYIYGTWQVLVGLAAVGFDMHAPVVRRAVRLAEGRPERRRRLGRELPQLRRLRHWPGRANRPRRRPPGRLLGLLAAGEADMRPSAGRRRVPLGTQDADGGWNEEPFTGTGFPRVFYLKYHMYPLYFPLMALGALLSGIRGQESGVRRSGYRVDAAHSAPSRSRPSPVPRLIPDSCPLTPGAICASPSA